MVSALSDSFLPNMGIDHTPSGQSEGIGVGGGVNRGLDSLVPPLSMQDRHPSAPQLASMLASNSVDSKPIDVMMDPDEQVRGSH